MTDTRKSPFVTMQQLDEKLEKLERKVPSRWEVRFLILAGMAAANFLPAREVANAAISLIN